MRFWVVNLLVVLVMTGYVLNVFASTGKELRIVSVNGALTEIIYELGAEAYLAGVDTTSSYPQQATLLPQVGYQRNLSAEGILSLKPTHILASADAGPPEVLKQIRRTGVRIVQFDRKHTVDSVLHRIDVISNLVGQHAKGNALMKNIKSRVEQIRQQGSTGGLTTDKKRVLFFLGIGNGSPMVAGSNTAADAMIEMAGGSNVFDDIQGYKSVSTEAIINAAPEVILMVSHGHSDKIIEKVLQIPGVATTPAGQNRQVIILDGLRFLGFGPRIANAIHDLNESLYGNQLKKTVTAHP